MASVSLNISRTETGQYLVVVNGEGFFNAVNKAVGARVRGEDTFFDDFSSASAACRISACSKTAASSCPGRLLEAR